MRFRRGLLLVAALSMAAGCGSVEATTQTSMLRGPTPSSGMTIPQLLQIPSSTAGGQSAAGAGDDTLDPAESIAPGSTDAVLPENPLTDVSDAFSTGLPNDTTTTPSADAGAVGPDLNALATSVSCLDYTEQPPDPLAAAWGTCVLDDQQVLLYGFSSDQSTADYAASLEASGVTTEELIQGPGYLIWADAGPIATIKAALGAG